MDCEHQLLFTTTVRHQITSSGFKPAGEQGKRFSKSQLLPWCPENGFYLKQSKPTFFHGDSTIQLFAERPTMDLEACIWTENEKGEVLEGKEDSFSAILDQTINANMETAFVCAKVRTIQCQICSAIDEVQSVYAAAVRPKMPAVAPKPKIVEEPRIQQAEFDQYVKDFDEDWDRSADNQQINGGIQFNPLGEWEQSWEDEVGEEKQSGGEQQEDDDYVPQWKRTLDVYDQPTHSRVHSGWSDEEDEKPRACLDHPFNSEW